MTHYKIEERGDLVFLTRHEKLTTSNLTFDLSKSIILEKEEIPTLLKVITDYANETGNQGV
jgi:hypothetical protein